MITQEQNNLLTQTGRSTPCGELMRRYWQPAALSEDLTADKPLPVTLFGEELILFRDDQSGPALIGRYCAHQGFDMVYGRVEPSGLRCMYHGWLFDACGKVVVRGDWLPEAADLDVVTKTTQGEPAWFSVVDTAKHYAAMSPAQSPCARSLPQCTPACSAVLLQTHSRR